ncbi:MULTISPECIES: hypothetical protein [Thermocrispum]|uniref:Uncharacterized protein n=1 Tax=Thermocrispum agreste TaxID=37925 RepID=A0ABD6FIS2_9PSEU|nr:MULTISPECIES: hypothetical protein [Thermocrispum]
MDSTRSTSRVDVESGGRTAAVDRPETRNALDDGARGISGKTTPAAMGGHALGGGLAGACDIRIAVEDAEPDPLGAGLGNLPDAVGQ